MSIKYNNKVIAGKYKEQVIPFANTVDAGIAKIATQEQINEGVDNTSIVTPVYLSQKQDKLTAGEGIDIDATNTISSTILPDKITIVENDNKTISTVARKTVNENIIYDWEGTQEEYQLALLNNEINPDWYCYITDDEQAVSYGDTLSRTLSNIAPEGEEVIKKLSKEAQGEEPSTGGGVGGGLPMFAHIWSDHIFNDVSYLRADNFSWHNGEIYITAYDILEQQYNNEKSVKETENGITYKLTPDNFKIADPSQEDAIRTLYEQTGEAWIYILDVENKRFKLPRENAEISTTYPKTAHVDIAGNGLVLGLTNGSQNGGLQQSNNGQPQVDTAEYGKKASTSVANGDNIFGSFGVTTDPTKSGIEGTADLSNIKTSRVDTNSKQYLYFYVGAYKRPETEVNLGELINSKVDLDGGNYKGSELEEYVNDTCLNDKRTNCITEIPQRIKYTLVDGTLTIKAGSQVIIPNGFEEDGTTLKFDYWNIENNISLTVTGTKTDAFLCLKNTAYPTGWTSNTYSGTDTTTKSDTMCYRTDLNRIIYNNDTTQPNYSFPLLKFSYTDGIITEVTQVFNGMGYIGSTAWVDKGVKGLAPNGRNEDGSLKNKEVIKPKLSLCTTSATGNLFGAITIASAFDGYRYIESETQPDDSLTHTLWYQPSTNLLKWHTTAQSGWATTSDVVVYGYYDRTNGVISNFRPKTTFRALDYNNKSEIVSWGLPDYENAIVIKTGANNNTSSFYYTAPSNGLFSAKAISSGATRATATITVNGNQVGTNYNVGASGYNPVASMIAPVSKGDEIAYIVGGSSDVYVQFIPLKGVN